MRRDRAIPPDYDTADAPRRLGTLQDVAEELGATPNQVVLARMMQGDPPIVPVLGVSTVDQLDEGLRSVDVELTPEHQRRLDT
ncbi:MAG TPA: aldo/keto reductase [Euzebyales bacterium]|nr:aldo/keto reductase [Euzebyales bacterium]